MSQKIDSIKQPKIVIENCPHKDRKHYAEGMCKYCYSTNGREVFAHKCNHHDKKTYARGLCRKCYTKVNRMSQRVKIWKYDKLREKIHNGEIIPNEALRYSA